MIGAGLIIFHLDPQKTCQIIWRKNDKNDYLETDTGAMLGGVCSGLGTYLNIDPVWVRLFFVLLVVTSGVGVLLYLILWIVVPREDKVTEKDGVTVIQPSDVGDKARLMGEEIREAANRNNPNLPLYIGIGLIVVVVLPS